MKSDEMDEMDNMYEADEASESSESEGMDKGETPESIDEEEADNVTAVIDNKVLSPNGKPLKEGDKITITVIKNYGDESAIQYKAESKPKEITVDQEIESLDIE